MAEHPLPLQDWWLGGGLQLNFSLCAQGAAAGLRDGGGGLQGLGCIGRVMSDRKQGTRAPVAQCRLARGTYTAVCVQCAEVVSSILTWSIVLTTSLRRLSALLSYYTIFDVFEFVLYSLFLPVP